MSNEPSDNESLEIKKIAITVNKLGKLLHFKCLSQAIAAQRLLKQKNINSQLYLGVNKADKQLKAHAWLKCGSLFVTGKRGYEVFTTVVTYHSICQ